MKSTKQLGENEQSKYATLSVVPRKPVAAQLPPRRGSDYHRGEKMRNSLLNLYVKFQGLKNGEEGQDLVEYALLVALIALVCITGVNNVASAVNTVFSNISTSLA